MGDLSAAAVVATAQESTGLTDFGGDDWREALDVLTESLSAEAGLSEFGDVVAQADLVGSLTRRLQIVDYRRTHPEVANSPIERPVFIVGQVRTGTTILFELLAQDPDARAPLTWEVDAPCPPPEATTYATDPRIEDSRQIQEMMTSIIPDLRAMHPIGPLLAQECVRITAMDLRSFIFPTIYHVPAYARWLLDTDMASAYRWHRRFLQHLQSRIPVNRWVLKSPGHIWALDAMMKQYPDARVIQTHRDPLRTIASVSSLACTLRTFASEQTPIEGVAREWAEYVIDGIDRSVDARESGIVPPSQVVDVQYQSFAADPIATVGAAYDQLGLAFTADAEARMRNFLDAQPAHEHGGHHYTFAQTGLNEEALRERTARYQNYFGVPNEPLG
ncbi:sulfotransferase family protein [Mycobacterium neglectum]|uniref:sulfotransferase family protein n=1 Tax=Mycobacterium neglectum TaxID=242737 RepID=UPI000BFEE822|nr:sulfotransferase [Mycobacterium neglectum]